MKNRRVILFSLLLACACCFSFFSVTVFAQSGVVTGSGVNVRKGPGTEYGILATLAKNTAVSVTG